ncbi:right-handed parallel beta-helix repeat-containing protein [Spirosoma arboris]|uniref:right-handed parallel beta-helix repeat-containing protein n=1 Tax=Spirosoma arboris TaxID=2682092 RepID=UPI0018DC2B17|nr:right-handed parallel beta-helix repeat-containing protein [Spirosoma arboris]
MTVSISLAQTTYYVASNGIDINNGRSISTPFQSLSRVNRLILQAGDSVLFRRGDTFRGTLRIRQSGSKEHGIHFDAYGSGNKPILAGSEPLGNWSKAGTNRWQADCSTCDDQVTGIYANGLALPLGRYPNADAPNRGSSTVQSHVGTTQLTSKEPLTINWTGAEAVLFPAYWIIDRAKITGQIGNTLTLANSSSYGLTDNWGYYIQNHPATLDQNGEWYYDPVKATVQLYYDQGNPNDKTITATTADRAIDIANASFITIQNLHITQARTTNLFAENVSSIVLTNDDFTDAGEDGITVQGVGNTILIDRCTITNCNNNGLLIGAYQNFTFRRSTIRHIGIVPGRGRSGDGQFTGFQSSAADNVLIENNVLDSTGYHGFNIGTNTIFRQNQLSNFCMTKSDGGGIYLWNGAQLPMHTIRIESNIIQKGVGTFGGLSGTVLSGAHGIYLDDCVEEANLVENTIFGCNGLGIYMHSINNVNVTRNTCFDNSLSQLILYQSSETCITRENNLQRNVLVAKTPQQGVSGYISSSNNLSGFGMMGHNYYARPFYDVSTIRAVYNNNVVADLSLPQWQTQFGQDLTSKSSPIAYKEYTIKALSANKLVNSSYEHNQEAWETWSLYGNGQAKWSNTNQSLGAGSLVLQFSQPSSQKDSYMLAYKQIQSVTKTKSYLIRFDAASSTDKTVSVFIRQRQSPYQDLTRRYEFLVRSTPKSFEFAFTPSADEADALLTFQLSEGGPPVSLNTISLQEAIIETVNPDDFIRIVYNPTTTDSIVTINSPYRDVKNHYYTQQVAVKPFSSVVLLRDLAPAVDVSLSLRTDRQSLKVGDIVSLSLSLHQEGANRNIVSEQVNWTCQLPASLSLLSGRSLLSGDSLLTGAVQQLLTDTTYVFRVKVTAMGSYTLAAQVIATTFADPDSTPDSGIGDGEDDQDSITLLVRELAPGETPNTDIVTALDPVLPTERGKIYPNPTTDEFTFTADDDVSTIRIVDLLGRERLKLDVVHRGQTIRFGQSLPDAYYLLLVQYKTGEQRVVKLMKFNQ